MQNILDKLKEKIPIIKETIIMLINDILINNFSSTEYETLKISQKNLTQFVYLNEIIKQEKTRFMRFMTVNLTLDDKSQFTLIKMILIFVVLLYLTKHKYFNLDFSISTYNLDEIFLKIRRLHFCNIISIDNCLLISKFSYLLSLTNPSGKCFKEKISNIKIGIPSFKLEGKSIKDNALFDQTLIFTIYFFKIIMLKKSQKKFDIYEDKNIPDLIERIYGNTQKKTFAPRNSVYEPIEYQNRMSISISSHEQSRIVEILLRQLDTSFYFERINSILEFFKSKIIISEINLAILGKNKLLLKLLQNINVFLDYLNLRESNQEILNLKKEVIKLITYIYESYWNFSLMDVFFSKVKLLYYFNINVKLCIYSSQINNEKNYYKRITLKQYIKYLTKICKSSYSYFTGKASIFNEEEFELDYNKYVFDLECLKLLIYLVSDFEILKELFHYSENISFNNKILDSKYDEKDVINFNRSWFIFDKSSRMTIHLMNFPEEGFTLSFRFSSEKKSFPLINIISALNKSDNSFEIFKLSNTPMFYYSDNKNKTKWFKLISLKVVNNDLICSIGKKTWNVCPIKEKQNSIVFVQKKSDTFNTKEASTFISVNNEELKCNDMPSLAYLQSLCKLYNSYNYLEMTIGFEANNENENDFTNYTFDISNISINSKKSTFTNSSVLDTVSFNSTNTLNITNPSKEPKLYKEYFIGKISPILIIKNEVEEDMFKYLNEQFFNEKFNMSYFNLNSVYSYVIKKKYHSNFISSIEKQDFIADITKRIYLYINIKENKLITVDKVPLENYNSTLILQNIQQIKLQPFIFNFFDLNGTSFIGFYNVVFYDVLCICLIFK